MKTLPPFDPEFLNIAESLKPLYENKELFGENLTPAIPEPNDEQNTAIIVENNESLDNQETESISGPQDIEIEDSNSQVCENNHLNQILSLKKEECDSKFVGINNFKSAESWLEDSNRVRAFEEAINMNKYLFIDKVVLDINSPYGLYGIFALKCGAKHAVIRVKKGLKVFVARIFEHNGFRSDQYSLVEKPLTEIAQEWASASNSETSQLRSILEGEKLDCILGEWQGTLLVNSEKVKELVETRDLFLKASGFVFPRRGKLVINLIQDPSFYHSRFSFWDDVYGFDMKNVKPLIYKEPYFDYSTKEMIKTWDSVLKQFGTQIFS